MPKEDIKRLLEAGGYEVTITPGWNWTVVAEDTTENLREVGPDLDECLRKVAIRAGYQLEERTSPSSGQGDASSNA